MADSVFDRNVFLNCPFDEEYDHILQAIIFCIVRFGLTPRIATERNDASETGINKILELISSSRCSIHDLSRCQARHAGEHFQEWYYERQLEAGFSEDDIQDYSTVELLKAMFAWNDQGRPRA